MSKLPNRRLASASYEIPPDIDTLGPLGDVFAFEGYLRAPANAQNLRLQPKANDPKNFVEFPLAKVLWLYTDRQSGSPKQFLKSTVYVDTGAPLSFADTPTIPIAVRAGVVPGAPSTIAVLAGSQVVSQALPPGAAVVSKQLDRSIATIPGFLIAVDGSPIAVTYDQGGQFVSAKGVGKDSMLYVCALQQGLSALAGPKAWNRTLTFSQGSAIPLRLSVFINEAGTITLWMSRDTLELTMEFTRSSNGLKAIRRIWHNGVIYSEQTGFFSADTWGSTIGFPVEALFSRYSTPFAYFEPLLSQLTSVASEQLPNIIGPYSIDEALQIFIRLTRGQRVLVKAGIAAVFTAIALWSTAGAAGWAMIAVRSIWAADGVIYTSFVDELFPPDAPQSNGGGGAGGSGSGPEGGGGAGGPGTDSGGGSEPKKD
jgi:hypothetical protein